MALLVRIKRKLNEEPLESVVLGRQPNQKRANVDDLRHALKDTSLNPQVFRLLTTASDAVSLPPNIVETIARRKKEWVRPRRLSPRKSVKSTFEQPRTEGLIEGQLQQSKSQRQARVWNCRRVKVQGFSVLELSGDDRNLAKAVVTKPPDPWLQRQPPGKDVPTLTRLTEVQQEAKMRQVTTKTIRRAKGWREWQQQHRPESIPPAPPADAPLPQHYSDLLKEYFGDDPDAPSQPPVNIFVSSSCISSSSSEPSDAPMPSAAVSSESPSSDRDYVWDLYYCCGSEMDPDPNAVELLYESEESDASEDSNAKEHDYTDEEEEGDSSSECTEEENSDGGVMNKRQGRRESEEDIEEEDDD